jgi:hypothetical protein
MAMKLRAGCRSDDALIFEAEQRNVSREKISRAKCTGIIGTAP